MYPSENPKHRRADQIAHAIGLASTLGAGGTMVAKASATLSTPLIAAVCIYVLCALLSNQASCFYHFAPWHEKRKLLRRIDHAAIYLSITGTFTPLLIIANTPRAWAVLWISWLLAAVAIYLKITSAEVKSRWSTASYLGLGAVGLSALPDLRWIEPGTAYCILAGSLCYVIGTVFYTRKSMPYRYAVWHSFVILGAVAMFVGIWLALF